MHVFMVYKIKTKQLSQREILTCLCSPLHSDGLTRRDRSVENENLAGADEPKNTKKLQYERGTRS